MLPKNAIKEVGFLVQSSIIILVVAGLAALINKNSHQRELAQQRLSVLSQAETINSMLQINIESLLGVSRSMRATLEVYPDIKQEEFSRIAERMFKDDPTLRSFPEILNVGAAPDLVLSMVYPFERNKLALGIDYRELPEQYPAVQAALRTRDPVISGPINLVQGGEAVIIRIAVDPLNALTPWGLLSVVVDSDELFRKSGLFTEMPDLSFALTRDSSPDGPAEPLHLLAGDSRVLNNNPVEVAITLPGTAWTLALVPKAGWSPSFSGRNAVWAVAAAVCLFVVLTLMIVREVQSRKRMAERKLSQAIGAIHDGFAMYDAEDRLVVCNEQYLQYYPQSASVMKPGTCFRDILKYGLERNEYKDALGREEEWLNERMAAHRSADGTVIQELADGRWLKVSESKLEDGSTVGFRVDITDLVRAREFAESADRAKTAFLNSMSHELRTPLSILLGYNSFLQRPKMLAPFKALEAKLKSVKTNDLAQPLARVAEEITRNANKVNASGRKLLSMIDKILEFANTEKIATGEKTQSVDLAEILNAVGDSYRGAEDGCRVSIHVEPIDATMLADADHLSRILNCLFRHGTETIVQGELSVDVIQSTGSTEFIFNSLGDLRDSSLTIGIFEDPTGRKRGGLNQTLSLDLAIVERLLSRIDGKLTVTNVSETHKQVRVSIANPLHTNKCPQRTFVPLGLRAT